MNSPKKQSCKRCKNPFSPIINLNGLVQSKFCPECRVILERLKRLDKIKAQHQPKQKSVKSLKNGIKTDLSKKSIPQLLKLATIEFNLFIRNRDRLPGNRFYCPTCKKMKSIEIINGKSNYQACHLFPAGHYPELRFNENNVFGGCLACNYYKHGVC